MTAKSDYVMLLLKLSTNEAILKQQLVSLLNFVSTSTLEEFYHGLCL
jgi:hypothetical protein